VICFYKLRRRQHRHFVILSFIVLSLFFSKKLFSQDLVTDRPDITESAITVPTGDFQIEDGLLFENQSLDSGGLKTTIHNYTFSTALLRVGITKNFEMRLGSDYLYQTIEADKIKTKILSINNLMIGSKFQLLNEESDGQDLGLLLQFYLPVGSESIRPKNLEPEMLLAYGRDISQSFSFSANIGGHWDSSYQNILLLYSISFDFELSAKWGSFFELYGNALKNNTTDNNFDFGLSYLLINNIQLDASAGYGPFSDFNDWFIGTGISIRLPH
jgi:Putative MetA-pathway of phenol degradation